MKTKGILLAILLSFNALAGGGDKVGGGGDAKTEGRIDIIRNDILTWINTGGAKNLTLSNDISYETYVIQMSRLLTPKAVVVTAILSEQEDPNDEELNTRVNGQPKTCKGFVSKKDGLPHILCNIERFWFNYEKEPLQTEADQYRQIHHEFAGLALLEKNIGAASVYTLSNQITSFLEPELHLKLQVKKPSGPPKAVEGFYQQTDYGHQYCALILKQSADKMIITLTEADPLPPSQPCSVRGKMKTYYWREDYMGGSAGYYYRSPTGWIVQVKFVGSQVFDSCSGFTPEKDYCIKDKTRFRYVDMPFAG